MTPITENELVEAIENSQGFCTNCKSFTNDFAEPDAENYTCDECGQAKVFGAEQALMLGFITIK